MKLAASTQVPSMSRATFPANTLFHLEAGDLQRLFARVAWRMRNGWAPDVPFVEKLAVISPNCRALLEDPGQGAGGALIEAHDSWGGCEDTEPDIECTCPHVGTGICFAADFQF